MDIICEGTSSLIKALLDLLLSLLMSIWRVHMHFTYIQRRTPTLNILFWQNAHSSQNSKPESHAELSREFGVVELGWLVRQSHMLKLFAVWIPKSCHSLWNSCKSQMPCRITTFQFYLLNVLLAPVSPPSPPLPQSHLPLCLDLVSLDDCMLSRPLVPQCALDEADFISLHSVSYHFALATGFPKLIPGPS